MQAFLKKIIILICVLSGGILWAQKDSTENDKIDTQKLIIIKPYSPTVSDAIKIKQNPSKEKDSSLFEKKEIKYDIYSVPVASTFTPEKGSASAVKRMRQPKLYDNYAAVGLGNYLNAFAEFYSDLEVANKQRFTIDLQHNSSQGGVKKNPLKKKDKYFDTKFGMGFKSEEDKFFWDGRLGFLHQQYNWYGIFDPIFSDAELEEINPTHNYIGVSLDGNLEMKKGIFDKISLAYQNFGDDNSSSENRVVLKPNFKFDVGDNNINTTITADFLSGKFKDHLNLGFGKYSFLNLGISPSYNYDYGDLAFTVGAEVFFSLDMENSNEEVFIHPKLKASYHIAEEFLTAYAGIDGGVDQNSYFSLAQENPYVAPQLAIMPTHTQFDFFVGAKGMLADNLTYDIRPGYKSKKSQALYHAFSEEYPLANSGFTYNNSFLTIYDDIKTFYLQGSLNYKMLEDLHFGIGLTYSNHSASGKNELMNSDEKIGKAWNLPELEASGTAFYQISDQWSVGAELYYIGERKDFISKPNDEFNIVKAKGFLDANLQVNFQLNNQLGFFLKGNNLFNDNYQPWYNYKAQGIQGMLGVSYQF